MQHKDLPYVTEAALMGITAATEKRGKCAVCPCAASHPSLAVQPLASYLSLFSDALTVITLRQDF